MLIMKRIFFLSTLFCALAITGFAQENVIARGAGEIKGQLVRTTAPLRSLTAEQHLLKEIPVRDENGIIGMKKQPVVFPYFAEQNAMTEDAAIQKKYNVLAEGLNAASIGANFNGIGYQPLNPPDPTLCVGPNHIIQMVNGSSGALLKVFNKTGGQVVAQTYLDAFTGKGGLGDPIALYDQLADRFVLIEFNNKTETTQEGLTFAISQTPDPTGSWYVYFFGFGTTFPDYPKVSVWNDAYYATTNDFANASTYSGSSAWAFDRAKMIVGDPTATAQRFTLGNTNKFFSMCPVLWQGTTAPPAGSGGLIGYVFDDAWTTSTTDRDSIGLLEFKVNFANAALSTVTHKSSMATTAYKSDICTATRGRCISQPGTTIALEALHQKVQNQPVYRNFGSYEGIAFTHLVDKGTNIAGVRWYELRKTTGNWGIYQQSTYAPDNTHRWLPSLCYDKYGNIGLAYNVSSSATGVYPGARFTGRKECDPLNTMTYAEQVIIAGTASNGSNRYGDYNHLVADPDGTSFWFTAEYNGASTWSTRIASFSLDACTPALCGDPTGLASGNITFTSADISWTPVSGAISYDIDYKASSSATWINAATAATATTINLAGLTQGTGYDWRVRATCAAGSGNYIQATFTTGAPCLDPTGLTSSSITSNSATLSWTAVSGASSYAVEYKLSTSGTWTVAAAANTGTSFSLTGLSANTVYDWRIRTNCAAATSNYTQAQFTTLVAPACPGTYDLVSNETRATAPAIPFNTNVLGRINTTTDNDYYRFVITTPGTITLTLTTLPANYTLQLYRGSSRVAQSTNAGTANETINYTATANTYYARVFGVSGANNANLCYTLKVQLGTATAAEGNGAETITEKFTIRAYPNPVGKTIFVNINGLEDQANVQLFDLSGRQVISRANVKGTTALDVSRLQNGIYFLRVSDNNGKTLHQSKFVKK